MSRGARGVTTAKTNREASPTDEKSHTSRATPTRRPGAAPTTAQALARHVGGLESSPLTWATEVGLPALAIDSLATFSSGQYLTLAISREAHEQRHGNGELHERSSGGTVCHYLGILLRAWLKRSRRSLPTSDLVPRQNLPICHHQAWDYLAETIVFFSSQLCRIALASVDQLRNQRQNSSFLQTRRHLPSHGWTLPQIICQAHAKRPPP